MATPTEHRVAVAMCEADRLEPYEICEVRVDTGTLALVKKQCPRWETYLPEARRTIAAFRALTANI